MLAVAAIMAASLLTVRTVSVDPDVLSLLPQTGPAMRAFRGYLGQFGSVDRVYVSHAGARARDVPETVRRHRAPALVSLPRDPVAAAACQTEAGHSPATTAAPLRCRLVLDKPLTVVIIA